MERLVGAVQELSLARDIESIMAIVRRVARELCGADGATFVLRDDGKCFYADEDAISPLWKGSRFPMEACTSGWAMLHRESVVIEDIYADARIPADLYRTTFVKSLAVVPIRTASPVGAIGNYWASHRRVTPDELKLLQALADSTSIAIENVQLISELEARVRARTAQLEAANRELEAFSYSVSHDLRAPLRSISGFSLALEEDLGDRLDDNTRSHVGWIRSATVRMGTLVDDMLSLARANRVELDAAPIDLAVIARAVADDLGAHTPERRASIAIADGLVASGSATLMRAVFENLLGNALKFTGRTADPRIEVGSTEAAGERVFFVRDNGAGFDMSHASRLFTPFQRLHSSQDFPGSGVGLATVQRIVHRHGGRIWAESEPGRGATFFFTLSPTSS